MPSATKKVSLVRRSEGHYTATNARGGQIRFGAGKDAEFTPVELLLAAIGGGSSLYGGHPAKRRRRAHRRDWSHARRSLRAHRAQHRSCMRACRSTRCVRASRSGSRPAPSRSRATWSACLLSCVRASMRARSSR